MIVDSRFEASLRDIRFRGGIGTEPGFYVHEVDGLLSGGEVTTEDVPRGFGPGAHDTDNRREDPRMITFRGLIIADSMTILGRLIDQLAALLTEETSRGRLVWVEFEQWRTTIVRRGAGWNITRLRSSGAASFVVRFRAPDQRIYGAQSELSPWGSTVNVVHRGGYPAPVSIQVRGDSAVGYTILGPRGSAAVVQRAVTPGSIHTYDGDTGLLRIDGVPQTFGVTRSDRIDVPKGAFTFNIDHGCELRVTFSPTWVP